MGSWFLVVNDKRLVITFHLLEKSDKIGKLLKHDVSGAGVVLIYGIVKLLNTY